MYYVPCSRPSAGILLAHSVSDITVWGAAEMSLAASHAFSSISAVQFLLDFFSKMQ